MSNGSNSSTTGTATSRLNNARRAVRRQTKARLALSGPSGAGKTWSALSIAQIIGAHTNDDGRIVKPASILVIDTEPGDGNQGASELYADHFDFDVIEWDPPYDPRDLSITLNEAGPQYDVIIVDSASHFWRGEGGTLDIADGRFGGWKTATPVQDAMIESILRCAAHCIVCTRAKQSYEVQQGADGKQEVRKLGLAPIQRDDLEYEFQVIAMIDMDHRIDIGKTRAAPLAGRSYRANDQADLGTEYREWLDAGVSLVRQIDAEAVRFAIADVPNDARRNEIKRGFKTHFGLVDQLSEDRLPEVWAWLSGEIDIDPHAFVDDGESLCTGCGTIERALWHDSTAPAIEPPPADEPSVPPGEPQDVETPDSASQTDETLSEPHSGATDEPESTNAPDTQPEPSPLDDDAVERAAALFGPQPGDNPGDKAPGEHSFEDQSAIYTFVEQLPDKRSVIEHLVAGNLKTAGKLDDLRARLTEHLIATHFAA